MDIDWASSDSHLLFNPRFPLEEKKRLLQLFERAPIPKGHICLGSSGSTSTGEMKWVILSKEALLRSADAVNVHLECDSKDIWLNPLPDFHVGGLSIWARAHLSGADVVDYKRLSQGIWDPEKFHVLLGEHNVTLTALVPTQVYDLVIRGLKAPPSLRSIIVGGGALSSALYASGCALGWNLLPSYGMTECASQVATAVPGSPSPQLRILSHVEASISPEEKIRIKSPALLTAYACESQGRLVLIDPKEGNWLLTEDFGEITQGFLKILGRGSNFYKIGGESVDLARLEATLERVRLSQQFPDDLALVAVPDERLGHVIHLAVTPQVSSRKIERLLQAYHHCVLPFEKIRKIHVMDEIPRSPLKKLLRYKLLRKL